MLNFSRKPRNNINTNERRGNLTLRIFGKIGPRTKVNRRPLKVFLRGDNRHSLKRIFFSNISNVSNVTRLGIRHPDRRGLVTVCLKTTRFGHRVRPIINVSTHNRHLMGTTILNLNGPTNTRNGLV